MNKHVTRIKQKDWLYFGLFKINSQMKAKKKSGKTLRRKRKTQTHFDIWTVFAKILLV